jgi:hypothetical protein
VGRRQGRGEEKPERLAQVWQLKCAKMIIKPRETCGTNCDCGLIPPLRAALTWSGKHPVRLSGQDDRFGKKRARESSEQALCHGPNRCDSVRWWLATLLPRAGGMRAVQEKARETKEHRQECLCHGGRSRRAGPALK